MALQISYRDLVGEKQSGRGLPREMLGEAWEKDILG